MSRQPLSTVGSGLLPAWTPVAMVIGSSGRPHLRQAAAAVNIRAFLDRSLTPVSSQPTVQPTVELQNPSEHFIKTAAFDAIIPGTDYETFMTCGGAEHCRTLPVWHREHAHSRHQL